MPSVCLHRHQAFPARLCLAFFFCPEILVKTVSEREESIFSGQWYNDTMKTEIQNALRYAGIRRPDETSIRDMKQMMDLAKSTSRPRWICRHLHLERKQQTDNADPCGSLAPVLFLQEWNLPLEGNMAASLLADCQEILVLAATLGLAYERALLRLQKTDIAQAVLFDAAGSALLEQFLDEQEEVLRHEYPDCFFTDRFSCGYGDLPLALQKPLSECLQLQRTLGIYVSDSCMMNPTKSVTAFIGLADRRQPARIRGCAFCSLQKQCTYKKEGKTCAVS